MRLPRGCVPGRTHHARAPFIEAEESSSLDDDVGVVDSRKVEDELRVSEVANVDATC